MAAKSNSKSITALISASLNKHGRIKGKTKKETKNLKASCLHHIITKKGKKRPKVANNGNGVCECYLCDKKFRTKLYDDSELKENLAAFSGMVEQAKFMAEAADLGEDTKKYLVETALDVSKFSKTYRKIRHVVEKTSNLKKKKKKNNGNNGGGSQNYGGWR